MKAIGLIGGISWESSAQYYQIINRAVGERLGGVHSCDCLMYSVDFAVIEALQRENDWQTLNSIMADAGYRLQQGGAELILICANTMHKCAEAVEQVSGLRVLHIADVTAEAIKKRGMKTVGLLGTRYTMEGTFYTGRLKDLHGIETLIPDAEDRQTVHDIIFEELVVGKLLPASKTRLLEVIGRLHASGAEGVILGCTELPLLVDHEDCDVPLFDTTELHALAGVDYALS